ncbi:hypothetical protein [Caenibacillus caldisaponilyticus]|nr:hypothetical protein [Caenibacillus caldisaponilyticus]
MKKVLFGVLVVVMSLALYAGASGVNEQAINDVPPPNIIHFID